MINTQPEKKPRKDPKANGKPKAGKPSKGNRSATNGGKSASGDFDDYGLGAKGSRWAQLDGTACAQALDRLADDLYQNQASRRSRYIRNQSLFEGIPLSTYTAGAYYRVPTEGLAEFEDPRRLIRSACCTARAEVYSKQKPKGQFQTSGADWKTRRKAQKLDKLHDGILNQRQDEYVNVWALMYDSALECEVQGTACIKVVSDFDAEQIIHEQVPCCELYFDPSEGRTPQNLTQISPIDADKAINKFCQTDDAGLNSRRMRAIRGAKPFERGEFSRPSDSRQIRMVEGWRLPYGPKEPGKYVIEIGGELMHEDEFVAPAFPFVFLHWERHRGSPWGMGIAQEGEFLAFNANDLHDRLLDRQRHAAGKRTYYWENSVDAGMLEANDAEVIISVKPGPGVTLPQETITPPFTSAEPQFAEMEVRNFWDALGISQVSAAARREPGVDSGTAIRTLNDTKAGRQLDKAKAFEDAFVDLAYQHVYRARELHDYNSGIVFRWPGGRTLQEVAVGDCLLDDKDFAVSCAPASNLPKDPAGRQAMVSELYQSGIIQVETYRQLLQWPDLEKELNVSSVEREYIDGLIDKYLDADREDWSAGDYKSPEGFLLDKNSALLRITAAFYQAQLDDAPAFNTGLLRRYAQELDTLIAAAAATAAANNQSPMPPAVPQMQALQG